MDFNRSAKLEASIPTALKLLACLLSDASPNNDYLSKQLFQLKIDLTKHPYGINLEFAPYIHLLIQENGLSNLVPEQLAILLKSHSQRAAMKALSRKHTLKVLEDLLARSGIEAVLLKGAAMDRYIYPEQAFRLGVDIDFLVREEDYIRIDSVLMGFADRQEKFPGKPAFASFAIEKPFVIKHPAILHLDVHRMLTIPHVYNYTCGDLFERAIPHPEYNGLKILSPEDNLLHFAIHGFYDMRLFSKQTTDGYLIIKNHEIDTNLLLKRAREYGMLYPLLYFIGGIDKTFRLTNPTIQSAIQPLNGWRGSLAFKLLAASDTTSSDKKLSFRVQQLLAQTVLSGTQAGYLRYNINYMKARLTDQIKSYW